MLNTYLTRTRNLLQNPSAPVALYSDADLTSYINVARGQLAGEGQCIRNLFSFAVTPGTPNYAFSALGGVTGISGIIHIRSIRYAIGTGSLMVAPRAWEWFERFGLGQAAPSQGTPADWAQYGQGSAGTNTGSTASGSFYINPVPDLPYVLFCDAVCYPIALTSDADPELIPFLWTDAVPYFAAYLALMSAQTSTRTAEAQKMFQLYQVFVNRARRAANPAVDTWIYEQADDPAQGNAYGQQPVAAQ